MSTAHRPTWDPAQAKDVKGGSRQFSSRDMAAHTKLKFRQPGQTASVDVAKRDLRAELLLAEAEARNKKRKAAGLPPLAADAAPPLAIDAPPPPAEDDASNKRRKLLQEALEMDRDDDDESGSDAEGGGKGKAKAEGGADADGDVDMDGDAPVKRAAASESSDSSDEEDDEDDEDDTAVLMRELEKIKRERAEEKARADAAANATTAAARDAEIATANPLLNLAAALGAGAPSGVNTTVPGTFAVKRRWDDDLIFKNQATTARKDSAQGQFVNDLLRTEFHKKFMSKFIK